MKRAAFLAATLLVGVAVATWFLAGTAVFNGFRGAFLRGFLGYTALVVLVHFTYLFLPKFGIGSDPRQESE